MGLLACTPSSVRWAPFAFAPSMADATTDALLAGGGSKHCETCGGDFGLQHAYCTAPHLFGQRVVPTYLPSRREANCSSLSLAKPNSAIGSNPDPNSYISDEHWHLRANTATEKEELRRFDNIYNTHGATQVSDFIVRIHL